MPHVTLADIIVDIITGIIEVIADVLFTPRPQRRDKDKKD